MKKLYIMLMLLIGLLFNISVNATEYTEKDVREFINNMSITSKKILENNKLTKIQQENEYKIFTDNIVDSEWVSRFILGNYWKEITPKQQKEFQSLYKEYLLENYIPKLKDYNKELTINKIENQKANVYMVYTKIKDNTNRDVNVNFRVIVRNNKLYITDIIPEGISFISSQRSDVGYSISNNGFDKFIEDLKSKISK